LQINQDRFRYRFEELAKIGATKDSGVHRPAFSDAHLKTRRWFLNQAKEIGLETYIDGAGNHIATLSSGQENKKNFFLGSHLDSVPNGGCFDGALGVVAALEVLQVVKENNIPIKFNLQAIDFTDEEGNFVGMMGSQAFSGLLTENHLGQNRPEFEQALINSGLGKQSILSAKAEPEKIAGYLELHIEQGTRLIDKKINIGIVTSIVGIRSFKLKFIGRADHAGTTSMEKRLDPTLAVNQFSIAIRKIIVNQFPGCVATIGNMIFSPGAFNVVPESITVFLEFRSEDQNQLDEMESIFTETAKEESEKFSLDLEIDKFENAHPITMNNNIQKTIEEASNLLNLRSVYLPSGAGHDAQSLAQICPAGMIFVPSVGGFSHSPKEFTEWQDCYSGANVLLQSTLLLVAN